MLAVTVDAPPLSGLESQLIDPEAANAERAAKRDEALVCCEVDLGSEHVLHAREDCHEQQQGGWSAVVMLGFVPSRS